tara:strand:- start:93 stop:635 length:543 start_codon:yes stop_codon:yes gene_type:complete
MAEKYRDFDNDTSFLAELEVRISNRVLADILCTAFEGGSNYWLYGAYLINKDELKLPEKKVYTDFFVHELILYGGDLKLELDEAILLNGEKKMRDVDGNWIDVNWKPDPMDDEGKEYMLTLDDMVRGYKKWVDDLCLRQRKEDTNTAYGFRMPNIDAGSIDAGDADCILQYALFHELVFC